ncbi:hypothetical protein LTR53_010531 [Teratosphaeriaceae sp. CCFEE 6253]|nr:hypothetical protein LTR53_010531 [Teratosphaeriaceae sp. CCFEE 6253]
MASYVISMLRSQLLITIPYPEADFSGQTIIITGSNTGLGREAARHIVRLNAAKVVLAVRTPSKGDAAAADITASCNVPASRVEVWQLSMSDVASIKAFAKRASSLDRLDAAILNAGMMTHARSEIDGMEAQMAVNVIGTLLLHRLLLPVMESSARRTGQRGRMTVVGSGLMRTARLADFETSGSIFEKLNHEGNIPIANYYKNSKLLVYYAVRRAAALSPVSAQSNVILTVQTPGICKSDIFRDDVGVVKQIGMSAAMTFLARTTEVGGRTLVHAVEPGLSVEAHGEFLVDCQIMSEVPELDNEQGRGLAGKWTEELTMLLDQIESGQKP